MLVLLFALALLIGLSLGLLGGGGAILTVPVLTYVAGMSLPTAVASSLCVVGATSTLATVANARRGLVAWREGFVFASTSMPVAFLVGGVADGAPPLLRKLAFTMLMLAAAAAMLRNRIGRTGAVDASGGSRGSFVGLGLVGVGVGAVTGFVGAGGGFMIVPVLTLLARVPIAQSVATSLMVIALNSAASLVASPALAEVPWQTLAPFMVGTVLGTIAGAKLGKRVSPTVVRLVFAWFLFAVATFVLAMELPPRLGMTAFRWSHWMVVASAITAVAMLAVWSNRGLLLRERQLPRLL